jgi:hypothetical protein
MKATKVLTSGFFILLVFFGVLFLFILGRQHIYLFAQVKEDQIGVKIRGGKIVEILPPGVYSDAGLFVRLDRYSTQEYKFSSADPEVITLDNQRIGVTVSGSVFRPTLADANRVPDLWIQYKQLYTDDSVLQRKMDDLSFQAMKVCVGDRPFQDSVIGSDRDALRNCIDDELNKLVEPFGLSVANVVVPNVTLSAEVQAKLDAITQSRLDTEKAQQDEKKAVAEGLAQRAAREAQIRVEQSSKQEEARQQTILAALEEERLRAQRAVIEAQKANDLITAQRDLEITRVQAEVAQERARADLAQQIALAQIYSENENYLLFQMALVNSQAIQPTDKLIFTPEGVFPSLVFGNNVLPTLPVGPPAPETGTQETTP